jgi:hypothetical protein
MPDKAVENLKKVVEQLKKAYSGGQSESERLPRGTQEGELGGSGKPPEGTPTGKPVK